MIPQLRTAFWLQRAVALTMALCACMRCGCFLADHEWGRAIDNANCAFAALGLYILARGWQQSVDQLLKLQEQQT